MKKTIGKIMTAITMTAMLTAMNASAAARPRLLKYDINKDGAINAIDASIALSEYAQTATGKAPTLSQTEIYIADCDGNKIINAVDASNILQIYAENSITKEKKPDTFITFDLTVYIGNDIADMGEYDSYEAAMDYINADKMRRKSDWEAGKTVWQNGKYIITLSGITYSKPMKGYSYQIYIEKF